jgi:anaerobic magnesium-protoporphyrin IX monomethyl ester cyclase
MKIALLNPTPPDISAFGVRSLSAYLRDKGHETTVVFYPGSIGLLREGGEFVYCYSQTVIDETVELCRDADLIAISFFSSYYDRARQLAEELKKRLGKPVVCGGIHPTTRPESVLEFADMVCIGEGETALEELLERMAAGEADPDVRGIWKMRAGKLVETGVRPLVQDLDTFPNFDFSNENHYILNKETEHVEPLTPEIFEQTLPILPGPNGQLLRTFRTMSDRGCPHRCGYCNVATLSEIYHDDPSPYLRSRSPENVIAELQDIIGRFPFIQAVQFFDDTFFARPLERIRHIATLYKENIPLPMYCQCSPNTLTEDKLVALMDAGCVYVEMGVQTGSPRIRKMYRRTESNEKILAAAELLHKYRDRLITPDYHIILDNPWETLDDTLETARLLNRLPKPFGLAISSLTFFPGTALYHRAVEEGLIHDELNEICRKPFYVPPRKTYVNFMIYLLSFQYVPKWLMRFLLRDNVAKSMNKLPLGWLYTGGYALGEAFRFGCKGLTALLRGDWQRVKLFLAKRKVKDPVVAGRKK